MICQLTACPPLVIALVVVLGSCLSHVCMCACEPMRAVRSVRSARAVPPRLGGPGGVCGPWWSAMGLAGPSQAVQDGLGLLTLKDNGCGAGPLYEEADDDSSAGACSSGSMSWSAAAV